MREAASPEMRDDRHEPKQEADDDNHAQILDQEDRETSPFWQPPQRRLAAILVCMFAGLIVIACLKPFDRIVDWMLPPPTIILIDSDPLPATVVESRYFWANSRPTPVTFPFRQCSDNTTMCCNGLENACELRVNEVMLATLHNAHATKEDGSLLEPNHLLSLESALQAGYRGLHLQVCNCNGVYEFCRGMCKLGSRNPIEVFLNIGRFLRDNPEEVLLLHLQLNNSVNQEVHLHQLYQLMQNATHFNSNLYVPNNERARWPTLRRMIEMDKVRLGRE
jgi:hypothetical protein